MSARLIIWKNKCFKNAKLAASFICRPMHFHLTHQYTVIFPVTFSLKYQIFQGKQFLCQLNAVNSIKDCAQLFVRLFSAVLYLKWIRHMWRYVKWVLREITLSMMALTASGSKHNDKALYIKMKGMLFMTSHQSGASESISFMTALNGAVTAKFIVQSLAASRSYRG